MGGPPRVPADPRSKARGRNGVLHRVGTSAYKLKSRRRNKGRRGPRKWHKC